MDANAFNILVPITLIVGVMFVIALAQYLSYRNRKRALEAVKLALTRDDIIDHKTIEAIAWHQPRRFADLRRGCLFLALAVGGVAFSFAIGDAGARNVLRGLTAFPAVIGAVYLFFHTVTSQSDSSR